MSRHNIKSEMFKGEFPISGRAFGTVDGFLLGWGPVEGELNGADVQDWAPGALFITTVAGSETVRKNGGTKTAHSFEAVS